MTYKWKPERQFVMEALRSVMSRWRNTPYQEGARVRGAGVDCAQLVHGVLDDLLGRKTPTPLRYASASAVDQSQKYSQFSLRDFRKGYASAVVSDSLLLPGDIILVPAASDFNQSKGTHAIIVAADPYDGFHAMPSAGAHHTPLGPFLKKIVRVYRPQEKYLWQPR